MTVEVKVDKYKIRDEVVIKTLIKIYKLRVVL